MNKTLTPREVFDQPDLVFLQSARLERQYFERKEAPTLEQCKKEKPDKDVHATLKQKINELREKIQSSLGSFAVSNQEPSGGLLVLGITDDGKIRGLNHLTRDDLRRLIDVDQFLENVQCQAKRVDCEDADRNQSFIYLLYVPFVGDALPCSRDSSH
jgi:hypothetical protein